VNIAVYFIRARSILILSCSSEGGFPIYIPYIFNGKGGGARGKRERRKSR